MCQFEGLRRRVAARRWSPRVGLVCRQARGVRRAEPAGARRAAAAAAAVPCAGGRMELNSLLLLLEAAEYLERRDREAEHGYASVLPFDGDFARKKTKTAGLVRKAPNNRSSHNELEKHRSCDVLHDWSITGGQQAQALSPYLALVSPWYGWWPMRLLHFVIFIFPLPVVTRCG
ncbi:max dimerization protein 4 isoform X3 [Arvicanthis niloticus]|uniref:max dimerization protein 4 isoform X3 n=1 Tax=Arvicanthis niloticus TaxID=61156 RepID=UPI00402BB440